MKYYSESDIRELVSETEANFLFAHSTPLNIRRCRDCEYFMCEHPTIETNGDFGYCEYRTNFIVMDDEPIDWYFTDINGFCNENGIKNTESTNW